MRRGVRRMGVLGGTFDPVHAGHLDLARACRAALDLDEVRVVTNRAPPHEKTASASGVHRHAMVALATAGDEALVADPRELEREGPSYTVLTLEQLARESPGTELFFLAGWDSLRDLATWHRHEDVLALATFVAVRRAGQEAGSGRDAFPERLRRRIVTLDHEPPAVSATALRAALARGESPDGVPAAVMEYILKNALYGTSGERP